MDGACGRDVDRVIVEGLTLVWAGHATRMDEAEVYAKAREATRHFWSLVPTWRWDGASVHDFEGTYGDYVLGKVGKVFPDLRYAL